MLPPQIQPIPNQQQVSNETEEQESQGSSQKMHDSESDDVVLANFEKSDTSYKPSQESDSDTQLSTGAQGTDGVARLSVDEVYTSSSVSTGMILLASNTFVTSVSHTIFSWEAGPLLCSKHLFFISAKKTSTPSSQDNDETLFKAEGMSMINYDSADETCQNTEHLMISTAMFYQWV